MLLEETVTYLEMSSPDQLRGGRPAPAPVEMAKLDRGERRCCVGPMPGSQRR